MFIPLLLNLALAKDLPGEELIVTRTPQAMRELKTSKPSSKTTPKAREPGNLPKEYLTLTRQSTLAELVQPPKGSSEIFRGIRVGDSIDLIVDHSVIAFPDEKAPVIAIAPAGALRGVRFIGESILEKNTKRIFIEFTRIIVGQQVYNLKGTGISSEGVPGLEGSYHSREAEYFAGDFISNFAAGYFDGLVPRTTNAYGVAQTDTSVDSAVKKGLSSGALSSADRFREKLKKVPEFSELKGPFSLKILILDQPKSTL